MTSCDVAKHVPYQISIHTPAKGVTLVYTFSILSDGISIHTPAKGVTGDLYRIMPNSIFQSTPPRRG